MLKLTSQKVPILKIAAPLKVLSGRVRVHVPFGRRVGERGDGEDRAGDEEEKRKMLVCHRDKNQSLASVVFSLGDAFSLGHQYFPNHYHERRARNQSWLDVQQTTFLPSAFTCCLLPSRERNASYSCLRGCLLSSSPPPHMCVSLPRGWALPTLVLVYGIGVVRAQSLSEFQGGGRYIKAAPA